MGRKKNKRPTGGTAGGGPSAPPGADGESDSDNERFVVEHQRKLLEAAAKNRQTVAQTAEVSGAVSSAYPAAGNSCRSGAGGEAKPSQSAAELRDDRDSEMERTRRVVESQQKLLDEVAAKFKGGPSASGPAAASSTQPPTDTRQETGASGEAKPSQTVGGGSAANMRDDNDSQVERDRRVRENQQKLLDEVAKCKGANSVSVAAAASSTQPAPGVGHETGAAGSSKPTSTGGQAAVKPKPAGGSDFMIEHQRKILEAAAAKRKAATPPAQAVEDTVHNNGADAKASPSRNGGGGESEGTSSMIEQQRKLLEEAAKRKAASQGNNAPSSAQPASGNASSTQQAAQSSHTAGAKAKAGPLPQADVDSGSETVERQRKMLEAYSAKKASTEGPCKASASSSTQPPVERACRSDATLSREPVMDTCRPAQPLSVLTRPAAGKSTSGNKREVFAIRRVPFMARTVPMLLQNRNGPCALLAVANSLLLLGKMNLRNDEHYVNSDHLVSRLRGLCEFLNDEKLRDDQNAQDAITELLARLPEFLDGLQLNCRFGSCTDFEFTFEVGLFDYFDLTLYHAWVDAEAAAMVGNWNALAETLAKCAEIKLEWEKFGRRSRPSEDEQLARGLWLEQWHENTRGQVTRQGLRAVEAKMKVGEVAVLFRNNHFSTVYKPREGLLCALLTDAAFEERETEVWEVIDLDGGPGIFLNGEFKLSFGGSEYRVSSGGSSAASRAQPSTLSAAASEFVPSWKRATEEQEKQIQMVQDMGFSREQAEAGLKAVDWKGLQDAVEAILEAGETGLPKPRRPSAGGGSTAAHTVRCPACSKEFVSQLALMNHREAKGH